MILALQIALGICLAPIVGYLIGAVCILIWAFRYFIGAGFIALYIVAIFMGCGANHSAPFNQKIAGFQANQIRCEEVKEEVNGPYPRYAVRGRLNQVLSNKVYPFSYEPEEKDY